MPVPSTSKASYNSCSQKATKYNQTTSLAMNSTIIRQCAPSASPHTACCQYDRYTDVDVLCVPGHEGHAGNQAFYAQAKAFHVKYRYASTPHEKLLLSHELVNSVHRRGGRFTAQQDGTGRWVEIQSHEIARTMARQVLRNPFFRIHGVKTTASPTNSHQRRLPLRDGPKQANKQRSIV